jgi:hypothetical protein
MILKILGIADQDDQDEQRLVLKATKDGNLSEYAVVDNTFKEGGIPSNLHQHYFSFPDYEVKEGDQIVLYTRGGNSAPRQMDSGKMAHFFYWDLKISVWNPNDTAHLLKIVESTDKKIENKK